MRRPTRQSVFRLEVCRSIPKKGISTHVQIPRAVCQARLYSGTAGPEIGTRRPGVGMRRPVWRHASLLNTLEIFTNPKHPPPRESCTPPKVPHTFSYTWGRVESEQTVNSDRSTSRESLLTRRRPSKARFEPMLPRGPRVELGLLPLVLLLAAGLRRENLQSTQCGKATDAVAWGNISLHSNRLVGFIA